MRRFFLGEKGIGGREGGKRGSSTSVMLHAVIDGLRETGKGKCETLQDQEAT